MIRRSLSVATAFLAAVAAWAALETYLVVSPASHDDGVIRLEEVMAGFLLVIVTIMLIAIVAGGIAIVIGRWDVTVPPSAKD